MSATESTSDYKESAFGDEEPVKDIPVKVHIIAPSTLPEGYVFEAEVGAEGAKKTISVEVVSTSYAYARRLGGWAAALRLDRLVAK